MNWYYAQDSEKRGPFDQASFDALVTAGTIGPETLVWNDTMANWAPWAQVRSPQSAGGEPPVPPPMAATKCAVCGGAFALDQLVTIGGAPVCAVCKPMRLQQLKEGVGAGGEAGRLTELLKVAKAQKGITWCILLGLLLYVALLAGGSTNPHPTGALLALSLGLILMPFQLIYVYRLASALDVGAPFLWAAGVFLCSCFGLMLLLILSSKATKVLREAGFKVGIMGANIAEIENAIAHGR